MTNDNSLQRLLAIALVGRTNTGKSTLLNSMIGRKVAITNKKVQTTLGEIRGVKTIDNCQLVFFDTPGYLKDSNSKDIKFNRYIHNSKFDTDIQLIVIDIFDVKGDLSYLHALVKFCNKPIIVVNKIDKLANEKLLLLLTKLSQEFPDIEIFPVSALKGKSIEMLLSYFKEQSHEKKWMYKENEVLDVNDKLFVSELTREQIYNYCHQEIPYMIFVETQQYFFKKNILNIHQMIFCKNLNHKKILIGKNGSMIKKISSQTRAEIIKTLKTPTNLFVNVQVDNEKIDATI